MAIHPHQTVDSQKLSSARVFSEFGLCIDGIIEEIVMWADPGTGPANDVDIEVLLDGSVIETITWPSGDDSVSLGSLSVAGTRLQQVVARGKSPFPGSTQIGPKVNFQLNLEDGDPSYFGGTSATSLTPSIGTKVLTTQAGLAYTEGCLIRVQSAAHPTDYFVGRVTDYTGTALTVVVDSFSGSTARTDWLLSITGVAGPTGADGADGAMGADGADGPPGADGIMTSVVAGTGITVNNTDPANPIVNTSAYLPGGTDIAVSDGGTGSSTGSGALTNLGLTANGKSLVTAADYAAMKTLLGLVIGTNVQAYDAALTALSNALSDLADPGANALLYWDDSNNRFDFLTSRSEKIWLPTAGVNGAVVAPMWDLPASNAPTPVIVTGTNINKGVLSFADSGASSAQTHLKLPSDWTGAIDAKLLWTTGAVSGNCKWSLQTAFSDIAASVTDDPSFNTADTVTTAAPGTANRIQTSSISGLSTTGAAAGDLFHLKVSRDGTDASDTIGAAAILIGVELTLRRTI